MQEAIKICNFHLLDPSPSFGLPDDILSHPGSTVRHIHFPEPLCRWQQPLLRYLFLPLALCLTAIIQSTPWDETIICICTLRHPRLDLDLPSHSHVPALSFLSSYTLTHPLTGCGYAAGQQAPRGIHLRPGNGNALYMNHAGWLQDHPAGWAGGVAEEYCQDAV